MEAKRPKKSLQRGAKLVPKPNRTMRNAITRVPGWPLGRHRALGLEARALRRMPASWMLKSLRRLHRVLGALIATAARAERLAGELAAGLAGARRRAAQRPRRPTAYFEEWDEATAIPYPLNSR